MDLMSLTAVELGKKIQAKEVTVEEAVKAAIASIKAKEEKNFAESDKIRPLLIERKIL